MSADAPKGCSSWSARTVGDPDDPEGYDLQADMVEPDVLEAVAVLLQHGLEDAGHE